MREDSPGQLAVVGLGYVGLPLATAFSKVLPAIGFDINKDCIRELLNGADRNGELDKTKLRFSSLELTKTSHPGRLWFTSQLSTQAAPKKSVFLS